jgi:hypothetical protein
MSWVAAEFQAIAKDAGLVLYSQRQTTGHFGDSVGEETDAHPL